jgi:hypothetical protein
MARVGIVIGIIAIVTIIIATAMWTFKITIPIILFSDTVADTSSPQSIREKQTCSAITSMINLVVQVVAFSIVFQFSEKKQMAYVGIVTGIIASITGIIATAMWKFKITITNILFGDTADCRRPQSILEITTFVITSFLTIFVASTAFNATLALFQGKDIMFGITADVIWIFKSCLLSNCIGSRPYMSLLPLSMQPLLFSKE